MTWWQNLLTASVNITGLRDGFLVGHTGHVHQQDGSSCPSPELSCHNTSAVDNLYVEREARIRRRTAHYPVVAASIHPVAPCY